jgi:hypothetical protein
MPQDVDAEVSGSICSNLENVFCIPGILRDSAYVQMSMAND